MKAPKEANPESVLIWFASLRLLEVELDWEELDPLVDDEEARELGV